MCKEWYTIDMCGLSFNASKAECFHCWKTGRIEDDLFIFSRAFAIFCWCAYFIHKLRNNCRWFCWNLNIVVFECISSFAFESSLAHAVRKQFLLVKFKRTNIKRQEIAIWSSLLQNLTMICITNLWLDRNYLHFLRIILPLIKIYK